MSEITKHLGIALSDAVAGNIKEEHLLDIFQESINNGDILLEDNEKVVLENIVPLIEEGSLNSSKYFEKLKRRIGKKSSKLTKEYKGVKVENLKQKTILKEWGICILVVICFILIFKFKEEALIVGKYLTYVWYAFCVYLFYLMVKMNID